MGSDVYRLGYSLESLRDMDTAELGSEEDKESTYISDSLDRLFQMIWEGYPKRDDATAQLPLADSDDPFHDSFRLTPLKAHLFDPERMPTLTRVRFRNVVLREVIELMSLTKEGKGKRRGRVSYSQLGINQLGAVYEALLSFRGFFAEEDLYEVQPAPKKGKAAASDDEVDGSDDEGDDDNTKASGQAHDELEVGHFVTFEQLKAYKREEIVPDPGTGNPKCYPKGSFIYRLAGRDREKSASYYTPESLTQCLVKYALKELLPGKSADDILGLKVCEPAMGSAAFLNEAVNQLAQTYLELRQQETGKSIPHDAVRHGAAEGEDALGRSERVRRRPQPGGGGAGRGEPLAQQHLHARKRPGVCALVQPAAGVRQFADRRPAPDLPREPVAHRIEPQSQAQQALA